MSQLFVYSYNEACCVFMSFGATMLQVFYWCSDCRLNVSHTRNNEEAVIYYQFNIAIFSLQIRSSFSKAFGGKKKPGGGSMSDAEGDGVSYCSDLGGGGITSAPPTPTHSAGRASTISSYLYAE